MRIGELAQRVGVSTDTIRFYERAGWLPRPARRENDYREYTPADADHLRLLIGLRRLDIPLEEAARIAGWCHSGHCTDASSGLPTIIARQRAEVAERIALLRELDVRLASLEDHIAQRRRKLQVISDTASCCDAAGAVVAVAEGGCACCNPA